MINKVLDFTAYFKNKSGFNTVEDNLDEILSFSDKAFNFIANNTKEDFKTTKVLKIKLWFNKKF